MSPVPQTLPRERILALLREQPARTAILCDIDGTLAPVVDRPEEASVPAPTRRVLEALSDRFGLVACISGRQAKDARRMVGIDALTYIGNHGLERLAPGADEPEVDPGAEAPRRPRAGVRRTRISMTGCGPPACGSRTRTRSGPSTGAAPPTPTAPARCSSRSPRRPGRPASSRTGGAWCSRSARTAPSTRAPPSTAALAGAQVSAALYGGDDTTDLDAFRRLRALQAEGALELGVCVGVTSPEGPAEIADEADLVVDDPDELRELLAELAA